MLYLLTHSPAEISGYLKCALCLESPKCKVKMLIAWTPVWRPQEITLARQCRWLKEFSNLQLEHRDLQFILVCALLLKNPYTELGGIVQWHGACLAYIWLNIQT